MARHGILGIGIGFVWMSLCAASVIAGDCIHRYPLEEYFKDYTPENEPRIDTIEKKLNNFPAGGLFGNEIYFCDGFVQFYESGGLSSFTEIFSLKNGRLISAEPRSDALSACEGNRIWRNVYGPKPSLSACRKYHFKAATRKWSTTKASALAKKKQFAELETYLSEFSEPEKSSP